VLVGNKSDLEAGRKVTAEEGKMFAEQREMSFFETFAKNNTNVEQCFFELIQFERKAKINNRVNQAPRRGFLVGNQVSVCCTLL
jgi:GTPase SAR1 family protein